MRTSSYAELAKIAGFMREGAWQKALDLLDSEAVTQLECPLRLKTWRAKCHSKSGSAVRSIQLAREVCDLSLNESQGQRDHSRLILARTLMKIGQRTAAMRVLARSLQESPSNAVIRNLLVGLVVNLHGDWRAAQKLLGPLEDDPTWRRTAAFFAIQSTLYVGGDPAEKLTQNIAEFAQHLPPGQRLGCAKPALAQHQTRHRRRVGLVSPMFLASAVYFLCIGALKHLAQEFDLVFFSRTTQENWAQKEFQSIATEWHEVGDFLPHQLATALSGADLYALLDLSGWLDPGVLMALSSKPVPIQIKWVGGQSTTTGLRAFDAFVTDVHQSPSELAHLYIEPLAQMPGGYVTYTPPQYMPDPAPASIAGAPAVVGIVSHPKKLSPPFLAYLRQQIAVHGLNKGEPVKLHFIGQPYGEAPLQNRILRALNLNDSQNIGLVEVAFKPTNGHLEQLMAMRNTDWIVDSFPYTGGLTALEALALGVPYRTWTGQHCAARHAHSHAMFAGLQPHEFDLQALGAFRPGPLKKPGRTLLPESSARLDHARLAADLARLLQAPTEWMAA